MSLFVDLSVGQEAVVVRQPVELKATVSNPDSPMVDNTVLRIQIPATIQVTSVPAGCSAAGNVVTCSLGTLELGASAQVTILVKPTKPGLFTFEAAATGTVGGFPITSNKATARLRVTGSPLARFHTPGLLTCDAAKPACTPPFLMRARFVVRLRG